MVVGDSYDPDDRLIYDLQNLPPIVRPPSSAGVASTSAVTVKKEYPEVGVKIKREAPDAAPAFSSKSVKVEAPAATSASTYESRKTVYAPQKQQNVPKQELKKELNELEARIKNDARKRKEADDEKMQYDNDLKKRMEDIKSPEAQEVFSEIYRGALKPGSGPVSYTHLTLPTKRIV